MKEGKTEGLKEGMREGLNEGEVEKAITLEFFGARK